MVNCTCNSESINFCWLFSLQEVPNALKSSRGGSSSGRSQSASNKEGKTAGKKRKLTALEEIRLVSGWSIYMHVCV